MGLRPAQVHENRAASGVFLNRAGGFSTLSPVFQRTHFHHGLLEPGSLVPNRTETGDGVGTGRNGGDLAMIVGQGEGACPTKREPLSNQEY